MLFSKPLPLDAGYRVGIDDVDNNRWTKLIEKFLDANIYQTWSYDSIRCGVENISHLVLFKNDEPVAASQARVVQLPVLGRGVAYIRWGPLWKRGDRAEETQCLRMAIRALRNEYVCKRKLILRIFPLLFDEQAEVFRKTLLEEKYVPCPGEESQRTLILDIQRSLEEIHKNFKQKWRNCLNRAEKNQLEVVEGTDDELFREFIGIYRQLLDRKRFKEPNDINEFRRIQKDLPVRMKMGIFLCKSNGVNTAGGIFGAIGDTGIYLFGATNDLGMKNKGSYLIQWRAIQWMRERGCRYYNLNGINPTTNPGGYHFKSGVAGKTGKEVRYLGRFDCYPGPFSSIGVSIATKYLPFLQKILSGFRK